MQARCTRRRWAGTWLMAAALAATLAGCGGSKSSSSGAAQLRTLNLASDVASVDLTLDDATVTKASAVDTLTDYVDVDPDTYDVDVLNTGSSSSLKQLQPQLRQGQALHRGGVGACQRAETVHPARGR